MLESLYQAMSDQPSLQRKLRHALAATRAGDVTREQLAEAIEVEAQAVISSVEQAPQGELGDQLAQLLLAYGDELNSLHQWVQEGGSLEEGDLADVLARVEEIDAGLEELSDSDDDEVEFA